MQIEVGVKKGENPGAGLIHSVEPSIKDRAEKLLNKESKVEQLLNSRNNRNNNDRPQGPRGR